MGLTAGMMKDMPSCRPMDNPVAEAIKEQTAEMKKDAAEDCGRHQEVVDALRGLKEALGQDREITFEVERDGEGLIKRIKARKTGSTILTGSAP